MNFFISTGHLMTRYFVRPDDRYVLNSLEIVDSDELLYRILKNDGFDIVVYLKSTHTTGKVYTFDALSKDAYLHVNTFDNNVLEDNINSTRTNASNQLNGLDDLDVFERVDNVNSDEDHTTISDCKYGLFFVANYVSESDYLNRIGKMLAFKNYKVAIVIDSLSLEQSKIEDNLFVMNNEERDNHDKNNIIVVTMNERKKLADIVRRNSKFHQWISSVRSTSGCIENDAVNYLEQRGFIVTAEHIGVDEIANLLLQKKFIKKDRRFQELNIEKVYPLAKVIYNHMAHIEQTIPCINYVMTETIIDDLLKYFENDEVVKNLVEMSKNLKKSNIALFAEKPSYYIERLTHESMMLGQNDDMVDGILAEFDKLVGEGMQSVKEQILDTIDFLAEEKRECVDNPDKEMPYINMQLLGNPGTGKSTIAELTAKLLYAKGVMPSGKYQKIDASEMIKSHVGETKDQILQAAHNAIGGVLFIDEFYSFNQAYDGGNIGSDAMNAIMSVINRYRENICVIVAGYEEKVNEVLKMNDGADRRFPNKIIISDYSARDLLAIMDSFLARDHKTLGEGVRPMLEKVIEAEKISKGNSFGNVGFLKDQLITELKKKYSKRKAKDGVFTREDVLAAFPQYKSIMDEADDSAEDVLAQFDKLVGEGIQSVKKQIIRAIKTFEGTKRRKEKNGKLEMPYLNMQFLGNPGTGKSTLVSLTAKLLHAKGILPTDKVNEVNASDLVKSHIGETKDLINKEAEKAVGGVLFIDEFYGFDQSYNDGGNIGSDAMNAILSIINKYKENICIIVAGYAAPVAKVLKMNPGGERRFPHKIEIPDYSVEDLLTISKKILDDYEMVAEEGVLEKIEVVIKTEKNNRKKSFGNVGFVKDELLVRIMEFYDEREAEDSIIRNSDVIGAYPYVLVGEEKNKVKNELVDRTLFENLPGEYAVKKYDDSSSDDESLCDIVEPAILYVTNSKGSGTAFLISPDGYAITCNHVIEGAKDNKARLRIRGRKGGDDSEHEFTVVNTDKDVDMALIKLEGQNFPYLNIAGVKRKITRGEKFCLEGYPFGERTKKDITNYNGIISSSDKQTDDNGLIKYHIGGEGKSGQSGSPIISYKDGRVIGVLVGSLTEKSGRLVEEINYMRPILYFWERFVK